MQPTTTMQKVFYLLLKAEIGLSERNLSLNGFRSRISNVRNVLRDEGIELKFRLKSFKNEFGHVNTYRQHYIEKADKPAATVIYKRILKTA